MTRNPSTAVGGGVNDDSTASLAPKCLSEEEVLRPVSRTINSDDWPIFLLEDAVVYGKDDKTPANLLNAELEGPFTIRGKLVVDREYHHLRLLKDKDYRHCTVKVKNVRGFSIGDGPITIWANGRAGWFEIKPTPAYQDIYDKMTEAIDLYYILSDVHTNAKTHPKKKYRKPLAAEQVFDKYIQEKGGLIAQSQVKKLCAEHARFLLSQMKNPSSATMGWPNTPFYKWLTQYSPDVYQLYRPASTNISTQAVTTQDSHQSNSKVKTLSSRSAQSNRMGTASNVVRFMNELHTSGRLRTPRMNLRSLARNMYEQFEIADEDLAKEIIRAHAKKIFGALGGEWAVSPIYQKLEIMITEQRKGRNSELHRQALDLVLQAREGMEDENTENQSQPSNNSPGEEGRPSQQEMVEPSPSPSPEPVHKKGAKSLKGAGKGVGKGVGKGAGLRLKDNSMKRSPTPSDEESGTRSAKRQKIATMEKESAEEEVVEDSEEEEVEDYEEEDEVDDEKTPSAEDMEQELELRSTILPSTSPQGPNGLWACHKDGCGHTIPNADEPEGRAMVQSHFLSHADEISARENLVLQAQRPYLPIGNLLEKLRRLGEAARLREDGGEGTVEGKVVPMPIKRRLPT